MGGQACVFYGAAEFSRDLDLLVLCDTSNLSLLQSALRELSADPIAVPPFDARFLLAGHAVHFRCSREDVAGLRIDVMSRLRGVADFNEVWSRRTTIEAEAELIDLMGLADLVSAKKTQRDKDWPMIRRLVEQSYFQGQTRPPDSLIRFWLHELRTPDLLVSACRSWPILAGDVARYRPATATAIGLDIESTATALASEEQAEKEADRKYWKPLRQELETLRFAKRRL